MVNIEYEYTIEVLKGKSIEEIPVRFQNIVSTLVEKESEDNTILNYVREKKWKEIKECRDYAETSGLPFKESMLDYDMRSAFKLEIAKQAAESIGEAFRIDWTMKDNSTMTLTLEDLQSIPTIASIWSNSLHEKARALRERIYNTADISEILEITWE